MEHVSVYFICIGAVKIAIGLILWLVLTIKGGKENAGS